MGGRGSGRWRILWKKDTVDYCRSLDINRWVREGIIEGGTFSRGCWGWFNPNTGEEKASIGYTVDTLNPNDMWVRLQYTSLDRRTQEKYYMDYKVPLQTTHLHFGGVRWWFTCPLLVGSRPCGRRVAKLYLPGGSQYFGCRQCHNLACESCQLSHNGEIAALAAACGTTPGNAIKILTGRHEERQERG